MNLDELRSVQSKERQKDSLQNLRPSFYQEVGEYIADLEDERDRVAEESDDPFSSPEVGRLTDEIETAKDVVEAIYERRMGKLVKQASLAAAGMPADDDGLTAEEADLFDDLIDRISSNKSRVLDVLEGVETEAAAGDTEAPVGSEGAGAGPADPRDAADPTRGDSSPAPGTDPTAADPMADPGTAGNRDSRDSPPTDTADDDAPPVPPQEPPADADGGPDGDLGPAPESGPESGSGDSSGVTPADVMGGDGPDLGDEAAGESPPVPDETPSDASSAAPDGSEPDVTGDAAADTDVERVTVRITRDVGSILGVDDREYALSTDDIVTLPEQNADPLLEQDAAEPLE
ncbi:conserved hypothetical protein-like protein [Haloterrigena turkmenica DSM 5511]|uniref:GINS subunit domain-containing protein n=1 Tax=Haloterrigena turkmenica (strain ATCC 51198 / DSM 5511 / JCM 9101 / NCIMB 13204 / VKM B-1734 / 4k) TaxID=543526 RepID=D2RW13_HALTV|nr:hypothetical protein [Haloterrigena turkmenica]ADB61442.1 conserved hypothetical protein-like protein [Haloterrigena turkmenica DSM 5511]